MRYRAVDFLSPFDIRPNDKRVFILTSVKSVSNGKSVTAGNSGKACGHLGSRESPRKMAAISLNNFAIEWAVADGLDQTHIARPWRMEDIRISKPAFIHVARIQLPDTFARSSTPIVRF